eukprot:Skav200223  [mRNA]  locus=scaffold2352:6462:7382:- [translate_table: standard]
MACIKDTADPACIALPMPVLEALSRSGASSSSASLRTRDTEFTSTGSASMFAIPYVSQASMSTPVSPAA